MSSRSPYYRKTKPSPSVGEDVFNDGGVHVDLSHPDLHLSPFGEADAVAKANAQFDNRAAAVVHSAAGTRSLDSFWPGQDLPNLVDAGILAHKDYAESGSGPVNQPTIKSLAIMAYADFFYPSGLNARSTISEAILLANPGWCGTFGPVADELDVITSSNDDGDYDMAQMHLLTMAYRYYDELTPAAREHLIMSLLAGGTVHGPYQDDSHTCGPYPETWSRAGKVVGRRVGETENHILMIMTARYLTNQLLYQRDTNIFFDNRRNSLAEIFAVYAPAFFPPVAPHADPSPGSCTRLLLDLLQRILRDDLSEYNAKPYHRFIRYALLNLSSYAYDHEVRLAARMVLDYLSAHFAVSSNDLRRLLPFRRRNEEPYNAHNVSGFMTCGILEAKDGADNMAPTFALLSGNVRVYAALPTDSDLPGFLHWTIRQPGDDQVLDALNDYRLPQSIHDLLVNDRHRRFYQRLHRTVRDDEQEVGGNRNCDNMEIYAGSPSYLITAGGGNASYAVDPTFAGFALGDASKQLGVAVTTTFMPTTYADAIIKADGLIQFSSFSSGTDEITGNYGVAPDFACGHRLSLPNWVTRLQGGPNYVSDGKFVFVNGKPAGAPPDTPGFYLAIYRENDIALLEAFDTWLRPDVSFGEFQRGVKARNPGLNLQNNVISRYVTSNGNRLRFGVSVVHLAFGVTISRSEVFGIEYGDEDPYDAIGDAGNVLDRFLNGTIMNSPADATVEINNPFLGTTLTLDMSDQLHPKRIAETGDVEQSGFGNEVWLDFEWRGPNHGDACQPLNTLAQAASAVAERGVIRIMPGRTRERTTIGNGKRMTLVAPIGGVTIGARS